MTIDEFNQKGFLYGDSIDIVFSNGYKAEDIPYYTGYYVKYGEMLFCAYPGYPHVVFTKSICGIWKDAGVSEGDTTTVSLHRAGKYKDIENAMHLQYSNGRADYESDEAFANYRTFSEGNMQKDLFYRSASPCNNQYGRASTVDSLLERDGIGFILDLADEEADIEKYTDAADFNFPCFLELYHSDAVALLNLSADYRSAAFKKSLVSGLRKLIKSKGPYLINCLEGKDRTGFVCALLESLAGADCRSMESDYMITYNNYYGISSSDTKTYSTISDQRFSEMIYYLSGSEESRSPEEIDARAGARSYLKSGGMTDAELDQLTGILCGRY